MQLDLVHRRHRVGLGGQPLQVLDLEVRDADRARAAVLAELLERPPGRDVVAVVERGEGPVDEEQVDVVEAQLGERAVERPAGVVGPVEAVVQLAGHEDVAAVEPGRADRLADAPLVAVHLGGVDVPVADLQRLAHGAAVSPGSIWKTPKPSCGIELPSFRSIFGTLMRSALRPGHCPKQGPRRPKDTKKEERESGEGRRRESGGRPEGGAPEPRSPGGTPREGGSPDR